ncbi:PorT family protein [Flavobacterium algicola]|uniref:PorT family protein n=1 Tax=Flavobacterium algicola TaxID=556529 RepID=UPI001EFD3350|nr:PorT family protein [Flavobacterium algicola]MCG9791930.1 PorT family protein [Flavobacterium algicola]
MKKSIFACSLFFAFLVSYAQYGYRDSNRISITFGINQTTLNTNNFRTSAETGWNGGLSMRGNFYNNWDMVYSIQFSENKFALATQKLGIIDEDVKYKLPGGQISLQLSYVVLPNHLSIEFGPIVQVNGKLKLDANQENNIISGTNLFARDIIDVSKFNFYPTIGISGGSKHLRLHVFYQYGLTNLFGNLKDNSMGADLKGNLGVINGNVIVYL